VSSIESSLFPKTLAGLRTLPPVLFLAGEEDELMTGCLKAFRRAFGALYGESMTEFNQDILYADKDDAGRVLDACQTLPVGMDRRIVILHEAQEMASDLEEELVNYLKAPNPTTSLVLLWKDSPDSVLKKPLALAAAERGLLVRCSLVKDDLKRAEWVRARFFERGRQIEPDACKLLAKEGGETLLELKGEVEKLLLFAVGAGPVRLDEVRRTLSFRPDQLVWEFINHLESGRTAKAVGEMERCLDQGEEPFFLLNLMARSARKISQGGHSNRSVQLDLFTRIRESDLALKSGHGVESGVLERLVPAYAALRT